MAHLRNGYTILHDMVKEDTTAGVILAVTWYINPNDNQQELPKYATWQYNLDETGYDNENEYNTYWGHYHDDLISAMKDFIARIAN